MKLAVFATILLFTLGTTAVPARPEKLATSPETPPSAAEDNPANGSTPATVLLAKRECWHGATIGCGKKGCWKRCGSDLNKGHWCWTTMGPADQFVPCGNDEQAPRWCNTRQSCNSLGCGC